jgi:alpha/beta superfamily hydrolase
MGTLVRVSFPSAGSQPVKLEGRLRQVDREGQWPAAVICHPHPLGGGTMHNGVVVALDRALAARGVMALRFNFRGVEGSEGQHDHGRGERTDLAGALDWLLTQPEVDPRRISVVGYSFGAWVALAHAQTDARVTAVAAVSLVTEYCDVDSMHSFTRPKFFVTGEHDQLAPPNALGELVDRLPPPKTLHLVPGADHFWWGREQEVADLVAGFVAGL